MSVNSKMTAIANAIRAKTGKNELLTLDDMPIEIAGIETGSGNGGDYNIITIPEGDGHILDIMDADGSGGSIDGDFYEGVYEVIPKIIQQTLFTKNKIMAENLTIKEIPFYEVSNAQKGKTIIIGGN